MAQKYTLVPISTRTGKPLKKVRTGQMVNLAIVGPKGGMYDLKRAPQEYFKTDFEKINQILATQEKPVFELYEQKQKKIKRDPETGKKLYQTNKNGTYRLDKNDKKIPIYETKLTAPDPRRRQKPLLFKNNKIVRPLDIGHKTGNKFSQIKELQTLKLLRPNKKIMEQVLQGKTLKEAVSNIRADIDMKHVRKFGLAVYYNVFCVIETPAGDRVKIPVSGAFRHQELGYQKTDPFTVDGKQEIFGKTEINIISNLQSKIAHSIRIMIKNAGYAFTSLRTLETIEKQMERDAKKAKNPDEKEKILSSIKGLYFGNKKRNFIDEKTKLTSTSNHKITLYVNLEQLPY
jgi:hypothetical protein